MAFGYDPLASRTRVFDQPPHQCSSVGCCSRSDWRLRRQTRLHTPAASRSEPDPTRFSSLPRAAGSGLTCAKLHKEKCVRQQALPARTPRMGADTPSGAVPAPLRFPPEAPLPVGTGLTDFVGDRHIFPGEQKSSSSRRSSPGPSPPKASPQGTDCSPRIGLLRNLTRRDIAFAVSDLHKVALPSMNLPLGLAGTPGRSRRRKLKLRMKSSPASSHPTA